LACLFVFFLQQSLFIELPQKDGDYVLHFKKLKYLIASCFKRAKHSIFIASFGLTDPDIIRMLENISVPIHIALDPKETSKLPERKHIRIFKKTHSSGIMHRKIICIDEEWILLGSTNLTPLALHIHQNLMLCIRSFPLFSAIKHDRLLHTPSLSYYPLPQEKKQALNAILSHIHTAKKHIFVAMYIFTHPQIAAALIQAQQRGVSVYVYLDQNIAGKHQRALIQHLQDNNISVTTYLGTGLLHHKLALIDNVCFLGSLNWTRSAFTKNDEYLLILSKIPAKEYQKIIHFFSYLHIASKRVNLLPWRQKVGA